MSYAQILVETGMTGCVDRCVMIASDLARHHEADLVGVYIAPPPPDFLEGAGYETAPPLRDLEARIAQHQASAAADAERGRQAFNAHAARNGVMAEWRPIEGGVNTLMRAARTADLVIVQGQPRHPGTGVTPPADALALASGGPVIVVPEAGTETKVGERIVVAWNGSREAARAMRDALPLLKKAQTVTAVVLGHAEATRDAEKAIPAYFERHGCAGSVTRLPVYEERPSEVLLRHVGRIEADLIVMGLYGHSRLREIILGGMSRDMLHRSPCPLLLSH